MVKLIKLGGTLLKEKNTYELLKDILNKEININKNKVIIVVSAIGRNNDPYATDTLKKLGPNLKGGDLDYLLGLGEIISSLIIGSKLMDFSPLIVRYNKIGIKKTNKTILDNTYLLNYLKKSNLLIVPGFIILNSNDELTTLDRGGSDLSAVLIAKMLKLKEITLYKETGGVMSADPKLVASPYLMKNLNYDDMYHLAKLGAKVIQKDAVKLAKEENIKILIKSLYLDELGSVISNKSESKEILGVSVDEKYIYLIGKVKEEHVEVINSLMDEYNISITKIKLMKDYILIEVINGKRNFALNLIHHKFMNKRS